MIRNVPAGVKPPRTTVNTSEPLAVLCAMLTLFGLFAFLGFLVPLQEWSGLGIVLLLVTGLALILYRAAIVPLQSGFSGPVFVLAFLLKIGFAAVNYWTVTVLYGRGDANAYYRFGLQMADYFRHFDFSIMEYFGYGGQGTTNMIYVTGFVYTILPSSQIGGFIFFAGLSFMGSVFFYRAYCLALPDTSSHIYRLLIFFLPSILFWTASIGKDAWSFLFSGMVCLGWVMFSRQRRISGWFYMGLGLFAISLIRPHIAAFHIFAMGVAFLFSRNLGRNGIILGLVGALLVIVFAVPILNRVDEYLRVDFLSLDSIEEFYDEQQLGASIGGSSFSPPNIFNPLGAVYGIVTILFRPFPFEAHNIQTLITSLEALAWLILGWSRRQVFWTRVRSLPSSPWLVYAAMFALLMALGLTVTGNFGIVARQRVVLLPLLWFLFA